MYYDARSNRVLLPNGISILTDDEYASRMIASGDILPTHLRVVDSEDSFKLFEVYGIDVGYDIDAHTEPEEAEHSNTSIDIDPDKYPRFAYMDDKYGDVFIDRLAHELDFFEKSNSEFIHKLMNLIDRFKEDGVIWGVGRGSACSSVLLYVIEVHDLDPIKYDIPFSELSKEDNYEY